MEKIKALLHILKNGKKSICYGAGTYGSQLIGFLRAYGLTLDYFVVSEGCDKKELYGVPIVNVKDIIDVNNYNWIIGVSEKYAGEIKSVLKEKHITPCFEMNKTDIKDIINDVLSANKEIHNIVPKDKRCFIMGTGETIRHQNIEALCDEDVFSCSYCSLLKKYEIIKPQYYILPALTRDWVSSSEAHKIYIREKIDFYSKSIISPIIICDYNDRQFIQYYRGFEGKKIYFLEQTGRWNEKRNSIYNLSRKTPSIQTGSIMMLKAAMYMGYKKIYLIGTEHDLVTHRYGHAYDMEILKKWGFDSLYEISVAQRSYIEKQKNRDILNMSLNMYNEYYYLHKIAKRNGIKIYNATKGGSLDEFERVEFDSLF